MKRFVALTLLAFVLAPGLVVGADDSRPGKRLTVHSAVLGEDRVALIRTPPGYETNGQRYPVLYMTDGDAQIGHTSATIEFLARSGRLPEMIVVGITNTDRTRDLTPTKSTMPNSKDPPTGGGADKFVKFIETELIPAVEKNYRTQPYRIFAGHSLGGLLAVHIFTTRNDLFDAYIAVSPSLWWDNQLVDKNLEEFLKDKKELHKTLILTLGNETGGMLTGFERAKKILGTYHPDGFVWDSSRMEDEHHGSVVLRSHYFALRKIFDGWEPSPKVQAGGMPGLEAHYKALSAKYKYPILPPEGMVNNVAYMFLGTGKTDQAIAIFQANVEHYPNSANCYDSLAEAYEKTGKLDLAKQNYERAVQIGEKNHDPNLPVYRKNFERVSKAVKDAKTAQKS
jgi:predicted alpha/beta superfamily hydrolase